MGSIMLGQDNASSSSLSLSLLLLLPSVLSLALPQPAPLLGKDTPQVFYFFPKSYDGEILPLPRDDNSVQVENIPAASIQSVRRNKRNPGCMRKCLKMRVLHPAQCHYLC